MTRVANVITYQQLGGSVACFTVETKHYDDRVGKQC